MITLNKGNNTKILSEESGLIEILKAQGWMEEAIVEPKKKDVKNGVSSTTGS